jgi:D-tyrosyl-tRNA(Tyr) deacylase
MRAVLQRVDSATVSVDGELAGAIGRGLVVLVGIGRSDSAADADYLVDKIINLRIFPDVDGRFDRSVRDIEGTLLVISQFTLYADIRKGRRPSFSEAAAPDHAMISFERLLEQFRATGVPIETGRFRESMSVELVNDGPVTIVIDSADRDRPRR